MCCVAGVCVPIIMPMFPYFAVFNLLYFVCICLCVGVDVGTSVVHSHVRCFSAVDARAEVHGFYVFTGPYLSSGRGRRDGITGTPDVIWLLIWVHGLGLTGPALQTLAIAFNMYFKMYFCF